MVRVVKRLRIVAAMLAVLLVLGSALSGPEAIPFGVRLATSVGMGGAWFEVRSETHYRQLQLKGGMTVQFGRQGIASQEERTYLPHAKEKKDEHNLRFIWPDGQETFFSFEGRSGYRSRALLGNAPYKFMLGNEEPTLFRAVTARWETPPTWPVTLLYLLLGVWLAAEVTSRLRRRRVVVASARSGGHKVFISYASADKTRAEGVCGALEAEDVACWMAPRDIPSGARYAATIGDAIQASELVLLVFSESANGSEMVERELELAAKYKKPIVPVRFEDVAPRAGVEFYISASQWFDAYAGSRRRHLGRLAESVKTTLAAPLADASQ